MPDPASPGPITPLSEGAASDHYELLDSRDAGGIALRGGVVRTAAFAGGLLLGLVSVPLLVRHLGDADFGRYASVLAVIAIVSGLTEGGVNTVMMRNLAAAKDAAQRDRTVSDLLGLRLVLSAVGMLIAVGFVSIAGYGTELLLGTLLAGVGMLFTVTQSLLGAILQARLRFAAASAIDMCRGLLTTMLIIVLVLLDGDVLAFLATTVPAGVVALGLTVRAVRGSTTLRPAFDPKRWMPLVRETGVFAVAVAVNSLYFRLTIVIMSLVATAGETGYFAISFRVMEVLVGVPVILTGAAFPIISRSVDRDRNRFDESAGRLFELSLMTGLLMSLALTLAAPFVIEVIAGSQDHPATDVLRIQALAMIASFVAGATGYPLLSLHRHRETLIANLSSLGVVVALALALTPSLGAQGGAIAAVVADFTLCIVNTVALRRAGGPQLPVRAIPWLVAVAGVAYGAARLADVHPLLETAIGVAAFGAGLLLLGRFPPEVRELLRVRVLRARH